MKVKYEDEEEYFILNEDPRHMARLGHCDFVLPDITGVTKMDSDLEEKLVFGNRNLHNAGGTPAPSAGNIPKDNNDDEEEIEQPQPQGNPLLRWTNQNQRPSFKNVVRSIIRARRWQIPLVNVKEEHSTEDLNKTWYEDQDTLHFNVNAFKAGSSGNAGLSKRARFILMKNAWERTEDELELIHSVVQQMKCFVKYSSMVRKELTRVMHFETFEDGRVIIQEGHFGFSMYFIVSGSVVVQVSQTDMRTGEKKSHVVGEVPAGSSFGELALIQDCKRTATIVCKGTSQFLRVDKPDFDMVLRRSYEQEWQDRLNILKSLSFFSNWNEVDLKHINVNCKIIEFPVDTIIVGDTNHTPEHFHFLVSGSCRIVRKITIMETTSHLGKGQTMLSLPPPGDALKSVQSRSKQLSKRLLVIGHLERSDYFGIGEDLTSTYVVTTSKVECLIIPRHAIVALERTSGAVTDATKTMSVREMLFTANMRLLSEEDSFERWMTNLRWKNYKKKMMRDILGRKPVRLPKKQKRRENPTKLVNDTRLQAKLSALGYPLAETQPSPCPVHRRAGYQRRDTFRLPPIDRDQGRETPDGVGAATDQGTDKPAGAPRKARHRFQMKASSLAEQSSPNVKRPIPKVAVTPS